MLGRRGLDDLLSSLSVVHRVRNVIGGRDGGPVFRVVIQNKVQCDGLGNNSLCLGHATMSLKLKVLYNYLMGQGFHSCTSGILLDRELSRQGTLGPRAHTLHLDLQLDSA